MFYCHSKKIGNRGDLVKHFALTEAIRTFGKQGKFTYLETHSGRALYELCKGGDWEKGVGSFIDRYVEGFPSFSNFVSVNNLSNIGPGFLYPGSSRIVFNALRSVGIEDIHFQLCDIVKEVCSDLKRSYADYPGIKIHHQDGYKFAMASKNTDLIFIDPPNISSGSEGHQERYMELLQFCSEQGRYFIAWNPLHGCTKRKRISSNCQFVKDFSKNIGAQSLTVRWTDGWSGPMCGCQMVFCIPNGELVLGLCLKLVEFMGWSLV